MQNHEPIIACNFGAIEPTQRNDHADIAESIFTSALEIKELTNGYAFRLPLETAMLQNAITWIANERLCCPFFTFTLEVGEQFWLQLIGDGEVKDFIKSTIVDTLQQTGKLPDKEAWIIAHTPTD
jgi:hypothetical protein